LNKKKGFKEASWYRGRKNLSALQGKKTYAQWGKIIPGYKEGRGGPSGKKFREGRKVGKKSPDVALFRGIGRRKVLKSWSRKGGEKKTEYLAASFFSEEIPADGGRLLEENGGGSVLGDSVGAEKFSGGKLREFHGEGGLEREGLLKLNIKGCM